jgi:putative phosphoribosyl transferase
MNADPNIDREVLIFTDNVQLGGHLQIPQGAHGIVIFAHGSGSSRHSRRNKFVAQALSDAGFGTLLFDLLTAKEEQEEQWTRHLRFDILLLARRLSGARDWLRGVERARSLPVGYFGASTGAAAALVAAAIRPQDIVAIVSRGGRPDLAGVALEQVEAPTLLIVGGDDTEVLSLNQNALQKLRVEKELYIVPGASHLFEEAGALEDVTGVTIDWFSKYFLPSHLTKHAKEPHHRGA